MKRTLARTGWVAAALAAGTLVAGCHFAVVPPKRQATLTPGAAGSSASPGLRDPYGARLADAPALLTQCLVDRSGLRPGAVDWFQDGHVTITQGNAADFRTWWEAHDRPGPYPQTFRVAGHPTHYLEFGTPWVKQGALWVPAHTGNTNPKALQYSLIAWVNWTVANDKLPPEICGPMITATQLQEQVFGRSTPDPW